VSPDDPRMAFYCLSDDRYFLGAVGLINSLRLVGHSEPILVCDCGLTAEQRGLLEPQATLVRGDPDAPPYLQKTLVPLSHPAEVMVLIDADMIVTRPLTDLIERAAGGGVVAFRNDRDRFVPDWGELLDLGTARRRPYASVGLVVLGSEAGRELLRLMDDRQSRVDFERTYFRDGDPDYAFMYPEQDVFNAILCTRVDPERVAVLDGRLAATPPYRGLRLLDETALRCAYRDGVRPFVLHQFVRKPWLEPMYHGIYPRLLARLLLGDDVAVRVPQAQVPVRMRDGPRARAERTLVNALDLGRWYLGERMPRWVAGRARALRGGQAGGDHR
jgi:hypothetical protein